MVPWWGQGPFRWRAADGESLSWTGPGQLARSLTSASRTARRRVRGSSLLLALVRRRWVVAGGLLVSGFVVLEVKGSWLQSGVAAAITRRISYPPGPGPSASVRYPKAGPYDLRLGYSRLPEFVNRLRAQGFTVAQQAQWSPAAVAVADYGLFPIYAEKPQAGLQVVDDQQRPLNTAANPRQVYGRYEDIPPLLVQSLLFVENRELLEDSGTRRNPAVEYPRLGKALLDVFRKAFNPDHPVSGGSTLATQLEKVRHSPGGRTEGMLEKGRQMASATLRVYRDGPDTALSRRTIVRDYINTLPLGAIAGYGEVIGLEDGLWAWYGAEVTTVNRLLAAPHATVADPQLAERAAAYRQAFSLLLAARRPTTYLGPDRAALDARVDGYLRALADAGLISTALRDATLAARVQPRRRVPLTARSFAGRKGIDGVRLELISRLGLAGTYDLDRLDLSVQATLDGPATEATFNRLSEIRLPDVARSVGLAQERMLGGSAPEKVIYSLMLYERTPAGNLLRVQADTHDQPLNINDGTRLELGSTAKLRTLASYLEVVVQLHAEYAALPADQLRAVRPHLRDRLRGWAVGYLATAKDRSLPAMLDAAMLRRYSASPGESFFTGGGLHQFHNFDPRHDGSIMPVRDAFRDSVNLVFVRLMRDVVAHHTYSNPEWAKVLENETAPARQEYLMRFADREGREFLGRFYETHAGSTPGEALANLAARAAGQPARLAAIFRAVRPDATRAALDAFLRAHVRGAPLAAARVDALYGQMDPARWSWQDLGYLARVHPLELWLVRFRQHHPLASFSEAASASEGVRQESYGWLFRTTNGRARQRAVETLVEADAFARVHESWRRQGYPFASLVPSLATALGSSGDNPAALSQLLGLVQNDGVRMPALRVTELRFGEGTPYDTRLTPQPAAGERIWPPAVATALRRELVGVVEHGTGRRLAGGVTLASGETMVIGGKTGTGDNRFVTVTRGGRHDRVVNRTATFAFTIGDRYFGTIVAFVPGKDAANYQFTSALPVQVMKHVLPALQPVLARPAS